MRVREKLQELQNIRRLKRSGQQIVVARGSEWNKDWTVFIASQHKKITNTGLFTYKHNLIIDKLIILMLVAPCLLPCWLFHCKNEMNGWFLSFRCKPTTLCGGRWSRLLEFTWEPWWNLSLNWITFGSLSVPCWATAPTCTFYQWKSSRRKRSWRYWWGQWACKIFPTGKSQELVCNLQGLSFQVYGAAWSGGRGGIKGSLEVPKPFWGSLCWGSSVSKPVVLRWGFFKLFCCSSLPPKRGGALLVEQGCVQQGAGCAGVVFLQKKWVEHRKSKRTTNSGENPQCWSRGGTQGLSKKASLIPLGMNISHHLEKHVD